MKQKFVVLAIPILLAISGLFYAFFFFNPPPSLTVPIDASTNVATFTINNLPNVSGSGTGSESPAIRIFLSHGDGTYHYCMSDELNQHTHQYAYRGTPYKAFAEIIPLYDDTDKPPSRTSEVDVDPTNTSISSVSQQAFSETVRLDKTADAVPGDSITYVINYGHPRVCGDDTLSGRLLFIYDSDLLNKVQTDRFFGEGYLPGTSGGGRDTLIFPFDNLQTSTSRSLYALMETYDYATLDAALDPAPHVEIHFNASASCTLPVISDTIHGQVIRASHDPNFKTVLKSNFCQNDEVVWRIDFQNEGNAPERSVVVADWIDSLVYFDSIEVIESKFPVSDTIFRPDSREVRVVMDNIYLRGLKEKDVIEEDTRGYVVLRTKHRGVKPCNALANRARILFGCNPPVITEIAFANFPCSGYYDPTDTVLSSLVPKLNIAQCPQCNTVLDTLLGPVSIPAGEKLLAAYNFSAGPLAILNSPGWYYKWYPAAGLENPFVLTPTLTSAVHRTYTLVASNVDSAPGCQRAIIQVAVQPTQPLELDIDIETESGCPNNPLWKLTATASGGLNPSGEHLLWNNCRSGTSTWDTSGLVPQKIYVAVWDTITGQSVEKWITLPKICKVRPPWPPVGVLVGLLSLIILGIGLFLYLRRKP